MSPYVDTETGEIFTGCPQCATTREECDILISSMERERRSDRIARTKAERAAERAVEMKRDGRVWKEILAYWQEAFPDKRVSSKGIKSARATKFFQRLEAGATPEDVRFAIDAAKVWQWVTFGRRTKAPTDKSKPSCDLEDIVSVGSDAQFDWLVEKGREMRIPQTHMMAGATRDQPQW